jgi:hypothetical protein
MDEHTAKGALGFYFIDWRHVGQLLAAGEAVFGDPLNICIWSKDRAGMGSFYRSAHEMILVFRTKGANAEMVLFTLPYRLRRTGGRVRITDGSGRAATKTTEVDDTLVAALKAAHRLAAGDGGPLGALETVNLDAAPPNAYDRWCQSNGNSSPGRRSEPKPDRPLGQD